MICWVEILILGVLEMWMYKVKLLLGCQSNSLATLSALILLKSSCLQVDLKHCHYTHLPCRFNFKNHESLSNFYFSTALHEEVLSQISNDAFVGRTSPDTGESISTVTLWFPFLITHTSMCITEFPNAKAKEILMWCKWGWIPQRSLRWLQSITMQRHLLPSLGYTFVRESKSRAVAQFIR